jgi:dolichyl-phosphate-mannose-protein mannosyltransferase
VTATAPPPPRERAGLGRTADGRPLPSATDRARDRLAGESAALGWWSAIGVAALALLLRLWDLGDPRRFQFDETYYAKDAWSLLQHGYAQEYVDKADRHILDGDVLGQTTGDPSMVVHPEAGKWMIAVGEWAFGMDPFGWRVSAAVTGALMVLVMVRLARRLTGSTLLGVLAGLLLAFDGLHLVLSRVALLDIFAAFWMLLGVHLIVVDRDRFRARLARLADDGPVTGWGPVRRLLWRPWLVLAGVAWGLAVGTKWTPVYALAAFGLLVWLWSAGARRSFGVRGAVLRSAVVDGVPAFLQLVGVALVAYVATWGGWLVHAHEYEDHLSSTQYTRFDAWDGTCDGESMTGVSSSERTWPTASEPDASGPGEVVQSLRSLWYYHQDVLTFHTHFLDCAEHTYASKPSGWLLLSRPVGVTADLDIQPGEQGCDAPAGSDCLRQVILLGNPVLWWGSLLALAASVFFWVGARDWRFSVPVVGVAATWLPWLLYDDRPIFSFYAILSLPFLVLACVLLAGRMIGPGRTPGARRTAAVVVTGSFLVLVLLAFAWFWPVWTDQLVTKQEWLQRIWFSRWV